MPPPALTSDAEVVPTEELAAVLLAWRQRFEREHDSKHATGDQINRDKAALIGPIQYLGEQSGLNRRQINAILNRKTRHTTLRIADRLLGAIDRQYLLATGEIMVLPNPAWNFRTYIEYLLAGDIDLPLSN
jgi:hypothetical protein